MVAANGAMRIEMKAFDVHVLLDAVRTVVFTVKKTGAVVKGPVVLPRKVRKYTVNKSPHVNKKSREQFEIRIFKLFIDVVPGVQTVEVLKKLDLPSGVDIKVELYGGM